MSGADGADEIILALDVGSSSIRCSAHRIGEDENHNLTVQSLPGCGASTKWQSVQPNTGTINLYQPDNAAKGEGRRYLLDEIDRCVDRTLLRLRERYENETTSYQAVGVIFSTFVMNWIGTDEQGGPIESAAISYACNTPEVAGECGKMVELLVEDDDIGDGGWSRKEILERDTGAPVHSAFALPQLRAYYARAEEDGRSIPTMWTSLASLCLHRWTRSQSTSSSIGNMPISHSEASWTGLFNYADCRWDSRAVQYLPNAAIHALPTTRNFDEPDIPRIEKDSPYYSRWPELRGSSCKLYLGLGDGACANIGSKCVEPDRIAVTIGTSAAARIVLPLPIQDDESEHLNIPSGLFCYRIDAEHILVGGALTDGGSVVEWLRILFQLHDEDCFAKVMARVYDKYETYCSDGAAPSTHLATIPFLSGERSTGYRAGATGTISGITRETTMDDIVLSSLEGVMLRLCAVLRLIMDVRKSFRDVTDQNDPILMASGNGLVKNPLWMQMLADCSGLCVVVDEDTDEATSRGAALAVAKSWKGQQSFTKENMLSSIEVTPRAYAKVRWDAVKEEHENVIAAMDSCWTRNHNT